MLWGMFFLLVCGHAEVKFHSLPSAQIDPTVGEHLLWQFPHRQFVLLSGAWEIANPQGGDPLSTVNLPGAFTGSGGFRFEKNVARPVGNYQKLQLVLGSVSGHLKVFLNDSLLYAQSGVFFSLRVDLPEDLMRDNNRLALSVSPLDLRREGQPAFLPFNMPRMDPGIWEAPYIAAIPQTRLAITDLKAALQDSGLAYSGKVTLNRALPADDPFRLTISYRSDKTTLFEESHSPAGNTEFSLPAMPEMGGRLWNPNHPRRVWIEARLDSAGKVLDALRQPLALRQFELTSRQFELNKRLIRVRGLNYLYQNPDGSPVYDPEQLRKDIADIRERGFNAIRVVLQPMPDWFYALCDELGMVVFQDLPLVYFGYNPQGFRDVFEQWKDHYSRMRELSLRYNSIASVGLAYYIDGKSRLQQRALDTVVKNLAALTVPTYVSTLLPAPEIGGLVDFQIVEILDRSPLSQGFQKIMDHMGNNILVPSGFTRTLNQNPDSAGVALIRSEQQHFYNQLIQDRLPGQVPGHFVQTYSDYMLHLPTVQNGPSGDPFRNQIGLVDLARQPRSIVSRENDFTLGNLGGASGNSVVYILIGVLNLFFFLISYRRYKVFRHNIGYSIRKPHGFFVNLSERISIPYRQSFFFLLVIAINGALVYGSATFFYRHNFLFDYLLSLVFFTPHAKAVVVGLIWNQSLNVLVLTTLLMAAFLIPAMLTRLVAVFGRVRVIYAQALATTIWSASPMVLLLPLGIFVFTMFTALKSYWILIGVLLYFHAWVYLRWINGTRVLTDRLYSRIFPIITLILLLAGAGFAYAGEKFYHVLEYLRQLKHLYDFYIGI